MYSFLLLLSGKTKVLIWGLMVCSVFSGVGFGAYCAVDFALVMDVLPDDKEKAKDLAVWHQVTCSVFKYLNSYTVFPVRSSCAVTIF